MRNRSQEVGHRHYLRLPVRVPVSGRAAPLGGQEQPGQVRNLGGGGLMAEFPVRIVPGTVVDLILHTRQGPLAITGQVAWADPFGTQTAHGIAFCEPRGDAFALEVFQRETG